MSLLTTLMLLAQIAPAVLPPPTGVVTGQLLNTSGQPAVGVRVSAMIIDERPGTLVSAPTDFVSIGLTHNE